MTLFHVEKMTFANFSQGHGSGNSTATKGSSQLRIPPIQLTNKNSYISIQATINMENINVKKSLDYFSAWQKQPAILHLSSSRRRKF